MPIIIRFNLKKKRVFTLRMFSRTLFWLRQSCHKQLIRTTASVGCLCDVPPVFTARLETVVRLHNDDNYASGTIKSEYLYEYAMLMSIVENLYLLIHDSNFSVYIFLICPPLFRQPIVLSLLNIDSN